MADRTLLTWLGQHPVGALRESAGLWSFEYAPEWLRHPEAFALAPALPLRSGEQLDGATHRPVQWYFDNLLPEETQRDLLAGEAGLASADAFGLLAWYGAESAGSLTLLPPETLPSAAPGSARLLPDEELAKRIEALPRRSLASASPKRMSLAGAQHKLAIIFRDDALFEPCESAVSTHIVKPDHPSADYPHSVVNEWFIMSLAAACGLPVPAVSRRYLPQPLYVVERFDRRAGERVHAIDACQLLGLDRSFKYEHGSMSTLAKIADSCRSAALARTRLFEWLAFNLLTGNSDAHLKNLSFLVSARGIELAPFYDLLAVGVYESPVFGQRAWPLETSLAWPLPSARRFGEVNRATLLEAGEALGLAPTTTARLLTQLQARLAANADARLAAAELENTALVASRPELARWIGGETRCLRALCHAVIHEMLRRTAE
jgi:serine/threonine-protein kinase HipA